MAEENKGEIWLEDMVPIFKKAIPLLLDPTAARGMAYQDVPDVHLCDVILLEHAKKSYDVPMQDASFDLDFVVDSVEIACRLTLSLAKQVSIDLLSNRLPLV